MDGKLTSDVPFMETYSLQKKLLLCFRLNIIQLFNSEPNQSIVPFIFQIRFQVFSWQSFLDMTYFSLFVWCSVSFNLA